MNYKITCTEENAPKFAEWIANRGGVAHWASVSFSDPGKTWSSPALTVEGLPYPKVSWDSANEPALVVTNPDEVEVVHYKEVKRFHVTLRYGGGCLKCTDASSARIEKACDKAGEDAIYGFDYETQEAVISIPDTSVSLSEWLKAQVK